MCRQISVTLLINLTTDIPTCGLQVIQAHPLPCREKGLLEKQFMSRWSVAEFLFCAAWVTRSPLFGSFPR